MIDKDILKDKFPFWDKLTDEEAKMISSNSRIETFPKGSMINRSGNECRGMLRICKGYIRVYFLSEEGREVTLFRLSEGDICVFSASCLLDSIVFDVFIEAVENTEAILIPSPVLHQIMQENVYVELFLCKTANERFSDAMWTMQQILFMGADRRVAIFLLDEIARTGLTTVEYTHDEIARLIGSAREVVSKILKIFSKEGIVELKRGKIQIIDKEKLKSLV